MAQKAEIDYGKALSWYIKDPKFWPIVLTLSLYMLSCIFILPMFYVLPLLTGYSVALIRKVQQGEYEILDVDSSYWNEGMKLILVGFAVGIVIGILLTIFMFGGSILAALGADNDSMAIVIFALIFQLVGLGVQLLISLGFPLLTLMAYAIYAKTGTMGSMFTWSNYQALARNNGWNLVIGYLVYYAGLTAITTLGVFACCVGVLPASVIALFVMAGVAGQFGVDGVED
jgi:hypothetical protein